MDAYAFGQRAGELAAALAKAELQPA